MQIDIADVFSTGEYQAYMANDTYVSSTFDGVPVGNNCLRWTTCADDVRYLIGSNLDDTASGGNPSDPYVIIEACQQTLIARTQQPYIYLDEISIIIY